jgi:hydrogenase maturation protease
VRVIALGQRLAGDDAVGLAIADRLRAIRPPWMEILDVPDGAALVELLSTPRVVVIVDAVIGGDAGRAIALDARALSSTGPRGLALVSSHGIDVPSAIALAEALYPTTIAPAIHVVGVTIARAPRFSEGMSVEVASAVDAAVEQVLSLHG